jgi:nucleotide-binding universal stress UspA family protein
MLEIKRILCPTDLSDVSRRSFAHAVALARWYGSDIHVLHVVGAAGPTPGTGFVYPGWSVLDTATRHAIRAGLEEFARPGCEAGVRVDTRLLEGDPVEEIVDASRTLPADLVVIGSHGRGGFERWVLGSVTEKVVRKSESPVLVVGPSGGPPAAPSDVAYERILCPVDFSEASFAALRYALSLAQEAGGSLTLVHVVEWPFEREPEPPAGPEIASVRRLLEDDARDRLRRAVPEAARDWCSPEELVRGGKAHREILRVAREKDAQLIVIGSQGHGPIERLLFGSTTHHILRWAPCPVLTIRPGVAHAAKAEDEAVASVES